MWVFFSELLFDYTPCREGGNLESRPSLKKSLNSTVVGKMKDSPGDVKVPSPGRLVYILSPDTLGIKNEMLGSLFSITWKRIFLIFLVVYI